MGIYTASGVGPKKKFHKKLTREVANRKTAVSLTYKPTTKPKVMKNLLTKLTPTAQGQIASLSLENKTAVKNILKTNASTLDISIEDIYAVMSKIGSKNEEPVVAFMGLFIYQNGQEMYNTIQEIFFKSLCHKYGVTE